MAEYNYEVQSWASPRGWRPVPLIEGSRDFCDGYVAAMDSMYPNRPYRIVRSDGEIYRETNGKSEVHLN